MSNVPVRRTTPAKTIPSDTRIEVAIGGSHPRTWAETVPDLLPMIGAIDRMRGTVKQLAKAARRIGEMPPEQRSLHLPALARAGQEAMKRIESARTDTGRLYDEITRKFGRTVSETLREVSGPMNSQIAAGQIRDYFRGLSASKRKDALGTALADLEVVRAILSAPKEASGLTEAEYRMLETRAIHTWLPEVSEARQIAEKSREVFTGTIENAMKMAADLAGLIKSKDGAWKPAWELDLDGFGGGDHD